MVDVTGGIATLTTAIGLAKNVKAVIDKVDDAQAKIQMADLISALADAKLDAAEKSERIVELEKLLKLKENMEYKPPFFWNGEDGPYCQRCWEADQKAIRLQVHHGIEGRWMCYSCDCDYTDASYVDQDPIPPSAESLKKLMDLRR